MATDNEIRAEQARQLLDNQVFKEAFVNTREAMIADIVSSPIENAELRNQQGLMLQCIDTVKNEIETYIQTAMLDIDQDASEKQI